MKVRDLIKELLDAPMDSEVQVKTDEGILDVDTINYDFPGGTIPTYVITV